MSDTTPQNTKLIAGACPSEEIRDRVEVDGINREKWTDRGFTIGAKGDEDLVIGETSNGVERVHEGRTGKFMLRMRGKEGNELVWVL